MPELRTDLRFYRGDTPDVIIIDDPRRQRRYQLYETECVIAKAMNGKRDLDAIAKAARQRIPWATRIHIEKLALQIAGMGLLSNVPYVDRPVSVTGENGQQNNTGGHLPGAEGSAVDGIAVDGGDAEDRGFDEPTIVTLRDRPSEGSIAPVPQSVKTPIGIANHTPPQQPVVKLARSAAQDPPKPPVAKPPSTATTKAPPASSAPGPPELTEEIPEVSTTGRSSEESEMFRVITSPAPERTEEEPPRPDAKEESPQAPSSGVVTPEDETDAPWSVETQAWYKRTWIRRLLYLSIPVAVVGALAVIQYPVYVTEQCVVRPVSRSDVRAPIAGILAEIYVDEGERVEAGARIARLDDRELSFSLRRAKAEVDRVEANLDKMRAGSRPEEVKRARSLVHARASDVKYARKELRRQQALFKANVGSAAERDEALRDLAVKRAALAEVRAELRLVEAGFREEEVNIVKAELVAAEAEVDFLSKQLESLEIIAPISGQILTPKFSERLHEKLNAGDLVAEIGDARFVRVEIRVPERDADIIEEGQPVTVKVHSYPLEPFTGTVKFIAPAVIEDSDGRRILRVDTELDNELGLLQPRMTGYAEIDTGDRSLLHRFSRRFVRWIRVRFLL